MNEIVEALAYQDEVWKKCNKAFDKWLVQVKDYRKTILARKHSDAWFMGYFLSNKFGGDITVSRVLEEIEEGWEEGKDAQGS